MSSDTSPVAFDGIADPRFTGVDTFTYKATHAKNSSTPGKVTVTVS